MPTEIVIDSSVIVALVTPELYSDWSSNRLSKYDYFHILDLSFYEVANAIKHKKLCSFNAKNAVEAFKQAMELMNLSTIHNFSEVITNAIAIALELEITVYDAAFLSLAEKLDTQLLSLDEKLAKNIENTKYNGIVDYPNKKI